jgi:uncharacterized membrane protein YraQ (UPF0718 family)
MKKELKTLALVIVAFVLAYHLPVASERFQGAVLEALRLLRWYAREHVLLCLLPAFFIAGAIGVFVSQSAVIRYLGPQANRWLAYGVASVSGTVLAVCSCTVLPLFGSIYVRGAGLGPAIAFLYAGPAINVLAIVLTARVLGWPLGVARGVAAIAFSVVIGVLMHRLFRSEPRVTAAPPAEVADDTSIPTARPLWQTALCFAALVLLLITASRECCENPVPGSPGEAMKWRLVAGSSVAVGLCVWRFMGVRLAGLLAAAAPAVAASLLLPAWPLIAFLAGVAGFVVLMGHSTPELRDWRDQTWGFARQILPLLMAGVLAAGFLLGSPHAPDAGLVPARWIRALVGDSPSAALELLGRGGAAAPLWLRALWPVWTNLFAATFGAFMYFATLTEVPIVRGLMDGGMGQGPALALLLAGPALSLPSMLVIRSILGTRKTLTFVALVIVMSAATGLVFGWIVR